MIPQKTTRRRTGEYRRILSPTDFSASAEEGVTQAARLAARDGAELVLLHVLPPVSAYMAPDLGGCTILGLVDQWRTDAWRRLGGIRDRIRQTGIVTHAVLREGDPRDQIPRVADRLRCDLIVFGTGGRPGFFRTLFDHSVAAGVMHHAPCPILAYRPPRSSRTQKRVEGAWKMAA